jgi:peptide alpha-N-acetyltransferase
MSTECSTTNKTQSIFLLEKDDIIYETYPGEELLSEIIKLMEQELSEPYPIFTYRYFVNRCPECNIIAYTKERKFIGAIIGECSHKKKNKLKAYIAMIAVDKDYRGKRIGKQLVELFIKQSKDVYNAHEVGLETEVTNKLALNLYESLGFVRTKRLNNYYLNGNCAYRLKYFLKGENDISINNTNI